MLTKTLPQGRPALAARQGAGRQPGALKCRAIKLYTNPGSRGKITEWYLGELGLEFTPVLLDMRKGEHKSPEFLAINPFGKVPAMEDDGVKLFESGAILLYLANKYGRLDAAQLGVAGQWTLFANSTMCEAFFNAANRPTQMPPLLTTLDQLVAKQPYLDGQEFSVSDIAVSSYLLYLPLFFPTLDLTRYPALLEYMERCAARPACPTPYKEALAEYLSRVKPDGGGRGGLGGLLQKLGVKS